MRDHVAENDVQQLVVGELESWTGEWKEGGGRGKEGEEGGGGRRGGGRGRGEEEERK